MRYDKDLRRKLYPAIAGGCLLIVSVLAGGCGLDSPGDQDAPATPSPRPPEATATLAPPPPTATPPASLVTIPTAEAPADDLEALQAELTRAIDETWLDGNYAFAVTDLQTGETVSAYGDVPQMSGCVMNLLVLYQAVLDVQAGRYALEEIDALVRATTWSSNAATAYSLYTIVGDGNARDGVARVGELIESLGLPEIVLDHPPGYQDDSLGLDYNNWVTAEAMNRALAALWQGELLEPQYRDYLLEVLADVKPGLNYLTAAVPEGIVSHKNGFFVGDTGYVDNDVGIVRLQRGGTEYAYAVSFLAEEVPNKYGDVVLGQQLGSLTYDVMAARYPETPPAASTTP